MTKIITLFSLIIIFLIPAALFSQSIGLIKPAMESGSTLLESSGGPWSIPDNGVFDFYFNRTDIAPAGAKITEVKYRFLIDDKGDPSTFRCADYRIYLSASKDVNTENDLRIYDQFGGFNDGGFDDDILDDSDIQINWRSTKYLSGESANQYWGIRIFDRSEKYEGQLVYLQMEIFWKVIETSDLVITVENVPNGNPNVPKSNANVQLYNAEGDFLLDVRTDDDGKALFTDVRLNEEYKIKVFHSPKNPTTIFGIEFWGVMEFNLTSANTNIRFVRNQPYKSEVKIFAGTTDVTWGEVEIGKELIIIVNLFNPSSESIRTQVRLILDTDQSFSYDLDEMSLPSSLKSKETESFIFKFTPEVAADYFSLVGTLYAPLLSFGFKYTDGDAWYDKPIVRVYDPARKISKPSQPRPYFKQQNVSVNITELDWQPAFNANGDSTNYRVFFGTDETPDATEYMGVVNSSSWKISPSFLPLAYDTVYYWRIIAFDGSSTEVPSDIWEFRTQKDPTRIPNKIKLKIDLHVDVSPVPIRVNVIKTEIEEGEYFYIPDVNFNTAYAPLNKALNAISGSALLLGDISDKDLLLEMTYFFDLSSGNPRRFLNQPLFIEMHVDVYDPITLEPYIGDFKFKRNQYAYFKIDKDDDFGNFLADLGLQKGNLQFYYLGDDNFVSHDIQSFNDDDAIYFRANHFSKFGGGKGQILDLDGDDEAIPTGFKLYQNYPNPFNPRTVIKFQVPSSKFVKLQVYDLLGREAQTLVNEYKSSGTYEVSFDASSLASGLYFYKLTAGKFSQTKKMMLLK
ncbi:MAG: T9SS type A sorting domain-containing protein [Bacteroidota bacterium]